MAVGGSAVHPNHKLKTFLNREKKMTGMKNRTTAGILAILLGGFGIHKFYHGNSKGGIIYLMDTDEKYQERIAANKVFDFA